MLCGSFQFINSSRLGVLFILLTIQHCIPLPLSLSIQQDFFCKYKLRVLKKGHKELLKIIFLNVFLSHSVIYLLTDFLSKIKCSSVQFNFFLLNINSDYIPYLAHEIHGFSNNYFQCYLSQIYNQTTIKIVAEYLSVYRLCF